MTVGRKLRIRVTDEPDVDGLLSARTVSLRERVLARLFGGKQKVTILVPGRQVSSVEIIEPGDDLLGLADSVGVTKKGGDLA